MKNYSVSVAEDRNGLMYPGLSIVFMQIFVLPESGISSSVGRYMLRSNLRAALTSVEKEGNLTKLHCCIKNTYTIIAHHSARTLNLKQGKRIPITDITIL